LGGLAGAAPVHGGAAGQVQGDRVYVGDGDGFHLMGEGGGQAAQDAGGGPDGGGAEDLAGGGEQGQAGGLVGGFLHHHRVGVDQVVNGAGLDGQRGVAFPHGDHQGVRPVPGHLGRLDLGDALDPVRHGGGVHPDQRQPVRHVGGREHFGDGHQVGAVH